MRYHRVEIEPRDLNPSSDPEKDLVTLGFSIQPPLNSVEDPEFLSKAADRIRPRGGFYHATLGYSDDNATYGSFETFGVDIDHVISRREQIMREAQLVFGAALGTTIQIVFPTEQ